MSPLEPLAFPVFQPVTATPAVKLPSVRAFKPAATDPKLALAKVVLALRFANALAKLLAEMPLVPAVNVKPAKLTD